MLPENVEPFLLGVIMEKFAKNVSVFIEKCAEECAKKHKDNIEEGMFLECLELKIKSPIEQLLYCALYAIRELNFIPISEPYHNLKGEIEIRGLGIIPQYEIGKYFCDFIVYFTSHSVDKTIMVECDSQKFHERTENERRYEKARDRFFIQKGYKTFHYTGSEIVKDPMKIALEIISYVTDIEKEDLLIASNVGE